jgi:hypothetical protein
VPAFDQDDIRMAITVEITNAGVGRCLRNSFEWNDLKSRYGGKATKALLNNNLYKPQVIGYVLSSGPPS